MLTAERGFVLARNPDVLLSPDVAFVRSDQTPPDEGQISFLELPPNLTVEVLLQSETARTSREKVNAHLEGGVQAV